MSDEWHAAARQMLTKQCEEIDILITTALIPGRTAPIMFTKEMVSRMKPGTVTVCAARRWGAAGFLLSLLSNAPLLVLPFPLSLFPRFSRAAIAQPNPRAAGRPRRVERR